MKIVFVLPPVNSSGGIRVTLSYAEHLSRRGHHVTVVFPARRRPPLRSKLRDLLIGRGWPSPPEDTSSHFAGACFEHREISPWRPIVDDDVPDADVVIATWWETAEWVARLSRSKGTKFYFIQGYEVQVVGQFGVAERLKATWRLPMHKIVVSCWLRSIAYREYGDQDVIVVPNAVDNERFFAPPRSKQSEPTVGMVYSSGAIKGCDISIRAYEMAKAKLPSLQLLAFGFRPPTSELPLPVGATFLANPELERIRTLYSSCDAWLFGSRAEGFGLPILEAMACRTPVIATPAGAAPELLESGGGFLVAPEDPRAMGEAIVRLCTSSPGEWQAMSERAHLVASSYSWNDATEHFEAALTSAVGRDKADSP